MIQAAYAIIESGSKQVHVLRDPSRIFRIIQYPEYEIKE